LSACLSTETLFQVLTFDPSCFSCFWLLPRYMGVWTWPTNHPLTFPDDLMGGDCGSDANSCMGWWSVYTLQNGLPTPFSGPA
jgi:hypothetical protein